MKKFTTVQNPYRQIENRKETPTIVASGRDAMRNTLATLYASANQHERAEPRVGVTHPQ